MIPLETKVMSEPLRLNADMGVVAWADAQAIEALYLAAISLAKLHFDIAVLPDGKRKTTLNTSLKSSSLPLFTGRILPFEAAVLTVINTWAIATLNSSKP